MRTLGIATAAGGSRVLSSFMLLKQAVMLLFNMVYVSGRKFRNCFLTEEVRLKHIFHIYSSDSRQLCQYDKVYSGKLVK